MLSDLIVKKMRIILKIAITGILFFLFFIHNMEAQQFLSKIPHPSIRYTPVRMNTNIDSIIFHSLEVIHGDLIFSPWSTVTFYRRSEDILTDTIYINNFASRVCKYNEKNQLLYDHSLNPYILAPYFNKYNRTDYEYDDEGRVVREVFNEINPSSNPPTITFVSEQLWDYSTIQLTEKGYIFNNSEIELDDLGRITLIKGFVVEDTIAELNGKKYPVNHIYLSYTDSSFTTFDFSYIGSRTLREEPTKWGNSTYVFNEDGNEIKCTFYISDDGINWSLRQNSRTEYKSSNTPSSNNDLFPKSTVAVYSQTGAICVNTEKAGTLQIFDLAGRMVKQQALPAGKSSINITPGLYFVRVDNQTFKIYVRR